ncbi:MAG TPA: extracellular solute-binding protein [Jatrophihabitans sp.]|jgi:cellobiose transport system substrate-binding protein|uniref:ABC transporter substrate-binding protein n=1 Tax=Jatrophihabitans sp. TaxID=1932789 RepID=UPI002F17581B
MPRLSRTSTRLAGAVAVAVLGVAGVAGCSSDKKSDTAAADPDAKMTLTVGLFGTFGFKEAGLYDAYTKLHPNITIKEDTVQQSSDYWTRLKTRLASGSGLADVQGIEIGFVSDVVRNHADRFVDFGSLPQSGALKSSFYDWKWAQATSSDNKTVGLGTDAGPEAICYRPDLLKAAGLPSAGAELASEWSTWQDYIDFGKRYESSATKPAGSKFVDSAASIFSTAVYQGATAYNDTEGNPDPDNSDGVRNAWKHATDAAQAKITAGLSQFSPPWNKAFSSGAFATIACPTWMMGYIQGQAGAAGAGKWSVAPVLPGGATNWGGSWLGVPKASKHQKEAIALVEWLTSKQQQITMWTEGGHWPSNSDAAEDPAVKGAKAAYFSNAPVGQIFGDISEKMKIPPIGLYDTQMQTAFTQQLTNVETKGADPGSAFSDALKAIEQVTG